MTATGAEYADTGGASRFFKVVEWDECERASGADESSSLPSAPVASAPSGAATSDRPEATPSSDATGPSTSGTASASRPSDASGTPTTPTIDSESSPESQPSTRSPTRNLASDAEPDGPIDTTMTTTSHSSSDGSVEGATSPTTPTSLEVGGPDSVRFRYCAKADSSERPRVEAETGGDDAAIAHGMKTRQCRECGSRSKPAGGEHSGKPWPTCGHDDWEMVPQQPAKGNFVSHPTVKPVDLMRWLVRLVTPPKGHVLDPFAGSGTTGEACVIEGFDVTLIEREADYVALINERLRKDIQPVMF
jgi:hypothetical protein